MKLDTKKIDIVQMYILWGSPVQLLLFEKYIVFAMLPKPFVRCAGLHITKGMLFQTV
jgi:hypothetical protein